MSVKTFHNLSLAVLSLRPSTYHYTGVQSYYYTSAFNGLHYHLYSWFAQASRVQGVVNSVKCGQNRDKRLFVRFLFIKLNPMRNNRTAGHTFERITAQFFKSLGFPFTKTSRYASRLLDDQKIDLANTHPFQVQCKYTQSINAHKVLSEMPDTEDKINLLFHKKKNQGTLVTMAQEDFQTLISQSISAGAIKPKDYAEY